VGGGWLVDVCLCGVGGLAMLDVWLASRLVWLAGWLACAFFVADTHLGPLGPRATCFFEETLFWGWNSCPFYRPITLYLTPPRITKLAKI
jgi:hypothetical protein